MGLAGAVDPQPRLGLVLHKLPVVGPCHAALIETLITLDHPGDLELMRDVVALDFHRLHSHKCTNSDGH